MRKLLMSNPGQQQPQFSDGTIRRFLLAQLSRGEQSAFETVLFTNAQLEQRARLAEIALIDDYVLNRLKPNDRDAFSRDFLVTTSRQTKLEVASALRQTFAGNVLPHVHSSSAQRLFAWPGFAWRIAFGLLALAILLASVIVIRREPQIVRKVIPKRWRPVAVATPTPQAAHHATTSSESPAHRDEPAPLPAHEASPQTIVLRANMTAADARVVDLTNNASGVVRLELMLERQESATFSILVTTSSGEVVHNVPEIRVDASDRIDFDVLLERLKPGDFQVTLTRLARDSGVIGTYYFRAK